MTLQAIVFDIGNVLIEWQPERFFDRQVGPSRRQDLFATVPLHVLNDEVDRGQNFTDTILGAADQYPAFRDEIHLWHDRWIEMASPEIPHSIRLLRALRGKGVPVLALSNFGIETFEIARRHYPFLEEFDQKFISGHMGLIKPDPAIYEALEQASGFAPDTLLFTDDRSENIAAAGARGWYTHLFEGAQGWADCLIAHGVLSESEAA
ncbi:HAD family hydrolase [Thalassovita taeanensis]|uniref:2-haloacid dehalogenase n=1 Tax=Thalassovita taeanensis TaxID=657014 RepID=A0A1H9DT29_9RHOB|nr:HAD family phosphatase [Thalassovita taeanensis]SEQ15878.1 2-haloacid dehalogenase [Thalassovita taeanensis]